MNQEQVKSMLLEIENTELEFSLIFSGKASKKVNGFYRPNSHEIILHNLNFKTDNMLIYTAIHEYAHHLITAKHEKLAKKITRPHTNEFWACFHGLLEIAEKKGFYVIGVNVSPELLAITENIKKNYLEKIGILQKELGEQLEKAHDLCIASNVRYVDYLDRCLQMSKKEASGTRKIAALNIDPSLGYENMKILATIPSPEKRIEAASQLRAGKSPDSVRSAMKKETEDGDETIVLEKEKTRLEKTIEKLSYRLEMVKEIIINGFNSIKESLPVMSDSVSSGGAKELVLPISKEKEISIKISKEQKDFLKQLQHEMNTQDTNAQSDPRFWVVMGTEREYNVDEDSADGAILLIGGEKQAESIEECFEYLKHKENDIEGDRLFIFDKRTDAILVFLKSKVDESEIAELMKDSLANKDKLLKLKEDLLFGFSDIADFIVKEYKDIGEVPRVCSYRNVKKIIKNTLFLTKRECEEAIAKIDYTHHEDVHSYSITADNSEQVARLYEILQTVDWDSVITTKDIGATE